MPSKLRFNHPGYTLMSHLFRRYLAEQDLDTKQAEAVTIRQFYTWGHELAQESYLFPDKELLQETYELDDEQFEFVTGLFANPFEATTHLYSWWPLLTLAARPQPKNKVSAISLAVSVQFADGLVAHLPMPLGLQSEPFTEGMVSALWRGQLVMIGQMLRARSLDELHDLVKSSGETSASLEVEVTETYISDIGSDETDELEEDED